MSSRARQREKNKGRRESGNFVLLPYALLDSPRYIALSTKAKCLLVDLMRQFNGRNNGCLGVAWKLMKKRGWRSKQTMWNAVYELEAFGFLMMTRQGSLHMCNLYAVTWKPIDGCAAKDVLGTKLAPGGWQGPVPDDLHERLRRNPKRPKAQKIIPASTNFGTHQYDDRGKEYENNSV